FAQFVLFCEHLRPVVRLGFNGIQRRLHIHRRPRVSILRPGAAHKFTAFQNHKIVDATFFQVNGSTLPTKATADNDDGIAGHKFSGRIYCCYTELRLSGSASEGHNRPAHLTTLRLTLLLRTSVVKSYSE